MNGNNARNESESAYPIVSVAGNSRQIGLQHGRQAQAQIKRAVAAYKAIFKSSAKLDAEDVRRLATKFDDSLRSQFPEYFEEMEGISEGSDVEFLDILALNCRSEYIVF